MYLEYIWPNIFERIYLRQQNLQVGIYLNEHKEKYIFETTKFASLNVFEYIWNIFDRIYLGQHNLQVGMFLNIFGIYLRQQNLQVGMLRQN